MSSSRVLDKEQFRKTLHCIGISILPQMCQVARRLVSNLAIKVKNIKPIINDSDDAGRRIILLDPSVESAEKLPAEVVEWISANDATLKFRNVEFGFDNMNAQEILGKLLPKGSEIPCSFEIVGHIAHLNLLDELLPYKYVIGQVILEKNKALRTVVNKVGKIETVFRTFTMEVLAGDPDLNVSFSQRGVRFKFNYEKVYWNSRLGDEHARITKLLKVGDSVCDMFCGVGPFALPAAKKGCIVHANDLNPHSFSALQENVALNKIQKNIFCYNMDGRAFVKHLVSSGIKFDHVLMNLPALAVEFLDVFADFLSWKWDSVPVIHCYGFSRLPDQAGVEADVSKRIQTALRLTKPIPDGEWTLRLVRDVAPCKMMFCASFPLPVEYLETGTAKHPREEAATSETAEKRRCLRSGDV